MTRQYPDLGSASDWSSHVGNLIQPVRSTTQIWIVTRHQYRISVLVSQTSFGGKTSGCVAKCPLFSRVTFIGVYIYIFFIGVCLLFTSHIRILERVLSSKTLQSFSNARFTISKYDHLTNSHLRICDLESYETTNLETQNYAESACENHGEIEKQLIGSEKK